MRDTAIPFVMTVGIGIGATVLIDVWNFTLNRLFGVRTLDLCLLGRWIGHMRRGVFRHRGITSAAAQPRECAIGWIAHYGIGVALAGGFVLWRTPSWLAQPTLLPALLYGIATAFFPLFVLQPSLGLAVAHPARARLKSLGTHAVYGIGLYLWAQLTP
jgi:hypothetical protein